MFKSKHLELIIASIMILICGCSTVNTFKMKVKEQQLEFTELSLFCYECQNNSRIVQDKLDHIKDLKEKLRETINKISTNYNYNSSEDAYTKYTLPINLEINSSRNDFYAFIHNKCYKFYYSYADNDNIYIFLSVPSFLQSIDGVMYNSIDKVIIRFTGGYEINFFPISVSSLSGYRSGSNWIHLEIKLPTKKDVTYFKEYQMSEILVLFNNTTWKRLNIF